ncbi:uracil DNA glycosylase [Pigeonpox virus]|uniref:Uracil-DNA glycosylase n=1 Tax=Pigeonpox virus TaxID=10264 RepID=A0A068EG39_9POXV|nr:uracil DNA glycosylase [Pigeonpox virus]AID46575.1 uracil DNA glycosylase [Pigeonpox virus]WCL40016.1 uracil DNA glycosylase [Pigeonpox virus]WIK87395.1 uracil DNA glycosylase [Oriental turtle dovepox virus]
MKTLKLNNWPYPIEYHEDWENIICHISDVIEETGPWLLEENTSPSHENIFKQLKQSLRDKRVCIVGIDPYPTDATGVPFESPDFSKKTIKSIAENISRRYNVRLFKNYNFLFVEGVLAWNYYLSCREGETKSHKIFWERLANVFINHIAAYVSVFYFLGKSDFSNFRSILNSPTTVVVGYHPAARNHQFDTDETFEIVNTLLELKNEPRINWVQGFEI